MVPSGAPRIPPPALLRLAVLHKPPTLLYVYRMNGGGPRYPCDGMEVMADIHPFAFLLRLATNHRTACSPVFFSQASSSAATKKN